MLTIRENNLNVYGEYAEVFNRIWRTRRKYLTVHEVRVVAGTENYLRVFKLIQRIRKRKCQKILPYYSNTPIDIKLSLTWRFFLPRPKIF
jgi:hypothetical protein